MALFNEVIQMLIRADVAGAVGPMKKLEGQATQTANAWDKAGKKIGVSGAQLKSGLAGLATGTGFTTLANGVKAAADAYVQAAQGAQMLSKVTNATVEDASRFNAVASRMGLGMNDLTEIFADFQQAVAKNPGALARMGVELSKNAQGQTDWINTAEDFLTSVQGIGDAAQRNTLMIDFFGDEGSKQLTRLLTAGVGLKEALESVSEGLIIHPEDVKAANDYAKALTNLKQTSQDLSTSVGRDLVPSLTGAAEGLGVWAKANEALPGDFLTRALPAVMIPLKLLGAVLGDDADAAQALADSGSDAGTAMEQLTATIASGATSGAGFADAVARAGDELAAQDANARLAAQALDLYRASTDQAYEATLRTLGLDRSERSAQRAAEGAADSAGDAKANMDKALADAKAAKTVVENIAAIRGRERKKTEQEGIVKGSTDVAEIEGIKGRKAQKKTRVIEAAGVITPAEARAIREATRQYEDSLDGIAAAWEAVADAKIKTMQDAGTVLTEAEKLDVVRQSLQEGLQTPGLTEESKAGIRADLKTVEDQIKALGGVPITITGIKFQPGTTEAQVESLQRNIADAMKRRDFGLASELKGELDRLRQPGVTDLKAALGLDPASVSATQAALANIGTDPKTGKPYTAKTVATVDKTQAQKDLDALTKAREMTVTVNYVPGTGSPNAGPSSPGGYPAVPGPRLNFGTGAQGTSFNPVVNNYYPKAERASDSIASALRVAKYAVGLS